MRSRSATPSSTNPAQRLTAEQRDAIEAAARNIETFHRPQLPTPIAVDTAARRALRARVAADRERRALRARGLRPAALHGAHARRAGASSPAAARASSAARRRRTDASTRPCSTRRASPACSACSSSAARRPSPRWPTARRACRRSTRSSGPATPGSPKPKRRSTAIPPAPRATIPPGPSEVLVIADASANAAFVASDLLSQAEHGADSQVLLRHDERGARGAPSWRQSTRRKRASRAARSSKVRSRSSSAIVVADLADGVRDLESLRAGAPDPADRAAARLAAASVATPARCSSGPWTPESVGDYCSGTNHVLPTYGFARRYSSLGVGDFRALDDGAGAHGRRLAEHRPDRDDARRARRPRRARVGRQRAARAPCRRAAMSSVLDLARARAARHHGPTCPARTSPAASG